MSAAPRNLFEICSFSGFFRWPAFEVGNAFQIRVTDSFQAYFHILIHLSESNFPLLGSGADDNFLGCFSFVGGRVSSDGLDMDMKHKNIGCHKLFLALSLCQVSEPSTLVLQPGSQLADWLWPWLGDLST